MLDGIDILIAEHENITRLNAVIRKISLGLLAGEKAEVEEFRQIIQFIRGYADAHHHGKEEKILFIEMEKELGDMARNLIRHGMLVEHDLGRLYVSELEQAVDHYEQQEDQDSKLDIISSAIGYTKLLTRHIDRENQVLFTFAKKQLSENSLSFINERTMEFETEANKCRKLEEYLEFLKRIEEKYHRD